MLRSCVGTLVALAAAAGCGRAADQPGPPVEVLGVEWKVGTGCAPLRIVVDVNTTGNAQIELDGRRTGEDGLLAAQSRVEMAADHIAPTATELVVQAVDRGRKGPKVVVPLPPRPRTGLRLGGQTTAGQPAVGLTCGADEAFADAHLAADRTLTATFTACDVGGATLDGGTITPRAPDRLDVSVDIGKEIDAATLDVDFPLERTVTLTDRAGQATACTLKVIGRIEQVAFAGGRAVPWAALAGPDAAVLLRWRDGADQSLHGHGEPWRAPLPAIGVVVDVAETGRTIAGRDCAYSGANSVPTVRRVFHATAFEARTGRALGERDVDGAEVDCPLNLTFENGQPTARLVGDVDPAPIVAWARTLR